MSQEIKNAFHEIVSIVEANKELICDLKLGQRKVLQMNVDVKLEIKYVKQINQ